MEGAGSKIVDVGRSNQ